MQMGKICQEKTPGNLKSGEGAAYSHQTGDWQHLKTSLDNMAAGSVHNTGGNGSRSLEVYPVTQSR